MKTVLLVEDEPINRILISRILTKRGGLSVKHTEDVEEILQIAQTGEVDIVLMDVSLKNSQFQGKSVDGLQITQLLKANDQTANLPVILVTANNSPGDRENFLQISGADGYIPKPIVDPDLFLNQVVQMLPPNSKLS